MSERIESAERLLATVQAGRAFVRALAQRHLPPGRALSIDLLAVSGADQPMELDDGSFSVLQSEMSLVAALASTQAPSTQAPLPPSTPAVRSGPQAPAAAEPPPDPAHVEPTSTSAEPLKNDQGDEVLFELSGSYDLPRSDTPAPAVAEVVAEEDGDAAEPAADSAEGKPALAFVPAPLKSEEEALREAIQAMVDAPDLPRAIPEPTLDDEHTDDEDTDPDADLLISRSLVPPRGLPSPNAPIADEDSEEIFGARDPLLRADTLVGSDPLFSAETLVGIPKPDPAADPLHSADTLVYADGIEPPQKSGTINLARPQDPRDEADAPEVFDPSAVEPTRPETIGLDEESASFEQTALFNTADIFGEQVGGLDPTAGWGSEADDIVVDDDPGLKFDPDDALVDELDDIDWGDDAPDLEEDGDLAALEPEDSLLGPETDEHSEEDEDVTRIDTPDPSVLAALRAAAGQPPVMESEGPPPGHASPDDFELGADELRWGDALGQPRSADVVQVARPEPADEREESAVDELDWGADTSDDRWRLGDAPSASDDLSFDLASEHDEDVAGESTDLGMEQPAPVAEADVEDEEDDEPGDTKMLSTRAFSRAFSPAMSVPRVVEPRPAGQVEEHTGAAAIQILGHGKAQTLTPTLELGGAPDESDTSSLLPVSPSGQPIDPNPTGSFRLQFEEPDEAATGPHIPVLTESEEVHHQPVVLTPDGSLEQPAVAPLGGGLTEAAIQNYLAHAEAAERRGNLREAVVHYDDLLSHDPHNVVAHLGRGRCLVDLGDYGSAMSDFTRAEDIAPDSPEPLVEMGNLFFARKEYKRAITYYNHAIDLDSSHAMAFSRRGISHYHRRQYAEAHHDLTEASKRDSSIPGLQRYIQMAGRKLKKGR